MAFFPPDPAYRVVPLGAGFVFQRFVPFDGWRTEASGGTFEDAEEAMRLYIKGLKAKLEATKYYDKDGKVIPNG